MYFSNIGDKELKPFHKDESVDITISLTEILSSDLFQVETIITDSLYRVFPLFYCNTITSSNPTDKILNNQCLILQKMEHETYLSFSPISHENNIIFYEDAVNSYDIGDSLSVDEVNGLIYLLRRNKTFQDVLNISEENQYLDNDIDVELNLNAEYDYNKLSNIKLKGVALNKKDNSAVANKTFLAYVLENRDEYKFVRSINTNNKGEYSFNDYSVNSYYDDSPVGSGNELQSLIDEAIENNESEITLTQQYKFNFSEDPIEIDSPIIINGNGHIIDADNRTRIFNVTGDNVTIKDIILKSGKISGVGGAISWTGANGLLTNVIIADCTATGNGGAVYWTGATGVIDGCKVINNISKAKGGGFYIECPEFKLLNIISFNNYSDDSGGCVYLVGDGTLIDKLITQKDTSNGSHPTIISSIGNNKRISNVTADSPYFNRSYEDRTNRSVNNEFNYKLVPSTWIKGDSEDYAVVNGFNTALKVNKSITGVMDDVMIFHGKYADYKIYNLNNQLKNSKGVIINDKIKNNPLRIQLMNNYFKSANYNLKGTVSKVNDINIDNNDNEIIVEPVNQKIYGDEALAIDLEDFENDSIFNNDIIVDIDFNSPEIHLPARMELTASREVVHAGESVVLTAIYSDNGVLIYNVPVTFKDGNTVIGVVNTDAYGEAVLNYTPTSSGAHSITAEYNNVVSDVVTVSLLSFDAIQLSSSKYVVESREPVILSAQLCLNGQPVNISGVTVTFRDSTTTRTAVTDSRGIAELSYTPIAETVIRAVYDNITSNSVNIYVISDIVLSSDKSILSYSDGDSATLSSQLQYLGEGVGVSGVSVDFEIYDENDILLNTLTGVTDNNGVATCVYQSEAAGNISIKANVDSIISNEIYIEDCYFEDAGVTGNKRTSWETIGNINIETNNDGTKLSSNIYGNQYYKAPILIKGDFSFEFTLVNGYWWEFMIAFLNSNNEELGWIGYLSAQGRATLTIFNTDITVHHSLPVNIKITREGSTIKYYENDILKATAQFNTNDLFVAFIAHSDGNRYTIYKDLKIKGL